MDTFLKEQEQRYIVTEGFVSQEQIGYLRSLLQNNPHIHNVMEIGFNGGHSAAAMLDTRTDIKVTSFDIVEHEYVELAKKLVDELFPGRHQLVRGNSMETLAAHRNKYDFVFVDGGHFGIVPESDIRNAVRLSGKGCLIVVDDINYSDVARACEVLLGEGIVKLHEGPLQTVDRAWITLENVA